ncbi:SRPBCC family protein [Actinoplanes oblitus]|uniref:SRPBCC family protein n=1 Tax=Actinoplanes oblitus TaxID=3040509 RepID=A0ABY8WKX9_9ACTN|nr:SRPBCC family protein [Actinoplanes oblitus]WIM98544.1 SRPBCC family protein [Actinoplanes oblitus]
MKTIATAQISTDIPAQAFFERWADMATWPEWNTDTEWVRLDGPFRTGATGQLKPKGGPVTRFVVTSLVPGREFTDVSLLLGARLTFQHLVTEDGGRTTVAVRVSIEGPLAFFWSAVLGKGIARGLDGDLSRLAAAARTAGVTA